nr:hypothetical protein [Paraburkholderia tuberum]
MDMLAEAPEQAAIPSDTAPEVVIADRGYKDVMIGRVKVYYLGLRRGIAR